MKRLASAAVSAGLLAALVTGCKDDEEPVADPDAAVEPTFAEVCQEQACGGDITGTWNFIGQCGSFDACPNAVVDTSAFTPSGQLTFTAEDSASGTFAGTLQLAGMVTYSQPHSCYEGFTDCGSQGCEDGTGETCVCNIDYEGSDEETYEDVPYSIEGNNVTMFGTGFEYCATSTSLVIKSGGIGFAFTKD